MLTEKDYCDYETCVALKELGYKVPTSAYYMPHYKDLIWVSNPFRGGYAIDCFYSHNSLREGVVTSNYIDAPTMWEAHKWLREEKNIHVHVIVYSYTHLWYYTSICHDKILITLKVGDTVKMFKSYEKALLEGIKNAVKILKDQFN